MNQATSKTNVCQRLVVAVTLGFMAASLMFPAKYPLHWSADSWVPWAREFVIEDPQSFRRIPFPQVEVVQRSFFLDESQRTILLTTKNNKWEVFFKYRPSPVRMISEALLILALGGCFYWAFMRPTGTSMGPLRAAEAAEGPTGA